ncbi:MAG TPA: MFS transporter [Thermoplasmata archaeon]|jgi:MFS family permease
MSSNVRAGGDTGSSPRDSIAPSTVLSPKSVAKPSYRRTLGNRPFFLLWIAQLVSQSGDYIFEVALLWLVLELTGSAFAVAVVVTGTILPGVLLGPFLGVFIDRWDRRRTLIVTNIVQGVVIAALSGLVVAGHASLPGLFVVVLMLGSGATTVRLTTNAFVPSVVPVSDLPPANSLLSVSGSMNQIIGLSIGGVFVALFGVALPIEYDALTFFAAAVLLLAIPRAKAGPDATVAVTAPNFRAEFAEGFAFVRRNRFMVEIIAIGIVVNFFGNGLFALFAPYAAFVLHGGAAVYGFLGAFVAAGALVGAGAMGRIDTRRSAGRYLLGGGIAIGGVVLALGLTDDLPVAFALMLALGITLAVTNIPISVVMQAKVPGRMLGRVGAVFGALVSGTGPAGPLFAGWLAQRWSVSAVFLLSGIVFIAVIAVAAATMTSLRSVEY